MKISIPIPSGDDQQPAGAAIVHADARPASAPPNFDIMTMFGVDDQSTTGATDEKQEEQVEDLGASPPVPPVAAEPPAPKPEDRLAQTTEALTAAVQALTGSRETPAPKPEEPNVPKVWLTPEQVPQAMAQLLTSEDPAERVKGIALFGNALASMIHAQYQKDAQEQYLPQAQAMMRDYYETQQKVQRFKSDLDTNYPILVNTEAGRLVAQHVIQQVSQTRHAARKSVDWFDPDFQKDFKAKLVEMKIDPKGVPAPAPAPVPPVARAPVGRSNGARPVDPTPGTTTQQDHMMGMLATVMPRAAN